MHIAIVAGEASGDILGSGLMREIKAIFPNVEFSGIGGEKMQAQGLASMVSMDRLSVMGLVEVLGRLPELLSLRKKLINDWINNPPDLFIGVDAPDFNLVIEERLRQKGILTCHYVSPSVWAWKSWRIQQIKRAVDLMLTLFPFEVTFYETSGINSHCVGHTLADQIPMHTDRFLARQNLGIDEHKKVICLMPGSRSGEVKYHCETFLETAKLIHENLPNSEFIIPAANKLRMQQIQGLLNGYADIPVKLIESQAQEALKACDVVLSVSGTATLEALLMKRPMVVCYKMSALSFQIVKRMIKKPYISLPNLLAQKMLVPEIFQNDANPQRLSQEVRALLDDSKNLTGLIEEFNDIHEQLKLDADVQAAKSIQRLLEQHGKA